MANSDYEPVVFLDADGNEISNDPVWHARNTLAAAGVDESTVDNSNLQAEIDAKDAEIEALKAALAAQETLDEDENGKDDGDNYDKLDGKGLKALAKERNVDIKGMTKVSQVREALRAADKA